MALTPTPLAVKSPTAALGSPISWTQPTRAESVQLLKRDISALGDVTRVASSLDDQSRALQRHVAENKENERRARRRQVRVLRRFAEASRAAFAELYDAERRAVSAQRVRDFRAHERQLEEKAEMREKKVFVAREVERIVARDFSEAVADVKKSRSELYAAEMEAWTRRVSDLRAAEDAKRQRLAEMQTHAEASVADVARHRERVAERGKIECAESAARDGMISEEIATYHRLLHDFEHGARRTQAQHVQRERRRYKRALEAARADEARRKELWDAEIRRRAAIMKAELADRQSIRSAFIDSYKHLAEMGRRQHAQRLEEHRADERRRQVEAESQRRDRNTKVRQMTSERRRRDLQLSQRVAAEAALVDRETRLIAVRDARASAVVDVQARRAKTLRLLRGEKAPSETPAFRVASGVSNVRDPLSPELREEVIRMIREH